MMAAVVTVSQLKTKPACSSKYISYIIISYQ